MSQLYIINFEKLKNLGNWELITYPTEYVIFSEFVVKVNDIDFKKYKIRHILDKIEYGDGKYSILSELEDLNRNIIWTYKGYCTMDIIRSPFIFAGFINGIENSMKRKI